MPRELSTQQKSLIEMLVQREHNISKAAAQLGIPAHVAQTWMNLPYMRTAFDQARREATTRLIEQVQAGNYGALPAPAVKTFTALADHPKERAVATQKYIALMQLYMELPISKVLTWQ